MSVASQSLVDELYTIPGKAEIVNGRIVHMSPAGAQHGDSALEIAYSLRSHQRKHGGGTAVGDNVGFLVDLPNRQSFSPDAAWVHASRKDLKRKFYNGAPAFAVEVRSPDDEGPAGERAVKEKIADYLAAGTLVVWDVDTDRDDVILCYRSSEPTTPLVFRQGDLADAEPAVPGWRFAVDDLFP
jgi:Uma2 family endonuclease